MKRKWQFELSIFLLCLSVLATYCSSTKSTHPTTEIETQHKFQSKDLEELRDLWLATKQFEVRKKILQEMEQRKSFEDLRFCFDLTGWVVTSMEYRKKDKLFIVQAFGRLKVDKAVPLLTKLLDDKDYVLRTQALDSLGKIKDPRSVDFIFPLLYDSDPGIRGKAIHTLGEIGDPRAVGRISMFMADKDPYVRELSESTLRRLGASEEKIQDWKTKAYSLSLDDVYRAKLSYEKAITEKEELQARLNTETDIKRQLEKSLKERDLALKRKEILVDTLYENERVLKSKLAQLDITKQQSVKYEKELERLNAVVQSLHVEIAQANSQSASRPVREELDKILRKKSELESDANLSRQKELMLKEEIAKLTLASKKTRFEAENAQKQLAAMRDREAELTRQVDELKKRLKRSMAPIVVISKPEDGSRVQLPTAMLHVVAVDDRGIQDFEVTLNAEPLKLESIRGLQVTNKSLKNRITINEKLNLAKGQNVIKIKAVDSDGTAVEEVVTIIREKQRGNVWAAVIGINEYPKARKLKYAVNDALAFRQYLRDYIGIPENNIFFLTNQNATRDNIQSLLGTKLKRTASKEDTVIIFYAGHGAVETDPSDPDGDGFEKYLLPYDANLNDLYTTSISMDEVRKIFTRIRSERLIFIADTCYSGASGGRTMVASKTRANLSDKFYERISQGKGRVIISSCSANEVSKEDDSLQHGIFSYYMLEGLKGQADQNGDGIITVSELFSFISRKVPEASAQDQHPVKKGETIGELVIGRIR